MKRSTSSVGALDTALQKVLARPDSDCAILSAALLSYLRATRRAKLAEVAALERLEAALTIQMASQPSEEQRPAYYAARCFACKSRPSFRQVDHRLSGGLFLFCLPENLNNGRTRTKHQFFALPCFN